MTSEEIWHRKSDDEVIAAAACLLEYTESGQQIIQAEMRKRGLTLPTVPELVQPRSRLSRYVLAVVACAAIVFAYSAVGVALDWKHGGGALPMILLFVALGATWRTITRMARSSIAVQGDERD